MDDADAQCLMRAIDNDDNASLDGLTTAKVKAMKNDVLQRLQLSRGELMALHTKLKDYRFIEDLSGLRFGSYVRWIDLGREPLKLTNGGIVCDMTVVEEGVRVTCKNHFHRMFVFNFSESIVFQRLSNQERVLLSALDYLNG